ncbi:MAG: hypothetical protein K0S32_885 [Bacteroidetes bacterium]|jgi:hypothetical protein|nr:hypothetical protein [Bacteroidota bacterium]
MHMNEYMNEDSIRIYTSPSNPFLIIEISGNLSLDEYKELLNCTETCKAIEESCQKKIFLELNGLLSVNMEQQDWTSKEFTKTISNKGINQLAIGVAKHVYPAFKPFWSLYEKTAPIDTRYFCSLTEVTNWLK